MAVKGGAGKRRRPSRAEPDKDGDSVMFKRDTQILRILTAEGALVTDGKARKVAGQLISDELGGISVPVRTPIPTLEMRYLDRAPVKAGSEQMETSDAADPHTDSQWILLHTEEVFDAARDGLDPTLNAPMKQGFEAKNILAVLAGLFLIVCVMIAGLRADAGVDTAAAEQQRAEQTAPARIRTVE